MHDNICWRWEIAAEPAFANIKFIRSARAHDRPNRLPEPFDLDFKRNPDHPLGDTGLTYQAGLSPISQQPDVALLLAAYPDLPKTGDHRSGLLACDGKKVVGGYYMIGSPTRSPWVFYVHPEYRGKGLAREMVLQWNKITPRLIVQPHRIMSYSAGCVFMSAYLATIEWALQAGKDVPQEVIDSTRPGAPAIEAARARIEAAR